MRKFLPFLACMMLTGGCAVEPMTVLLAGGATVASYSVTGKSPLDYGLSRARQQDCDIRNPKRHAGAYCVNTDPAAPADDPVYCYPTLGVPYCSRQLDPYRNGNEPLDGSGRGVVASARPTETATRPVTLTPASSPPPSARGSSPPPPAHDAALHGS